MKPRKNDEAEFPVSLDEFIGSLPKAQIESRRAFGDLMQKTERGKKPAAQWQRLYELFQGQPTDMPWAQWLSQNEGRK